MDESSILQDIPIEEQEGTKTDSTAAVLASINVEVAAITDQVTRDVEALQTPEADKLHEAAQYIEAQLADALDKLANLPLENTVDENARLRLENKALQETLGLNSRHDVLLEASLFIDFPFLKVSLLREDENPEELFGIQAWKGWLEARKAAKDIDVLTIDDIKNLHVLLTQGMAKGIQGELRKGWALGSDYTELGAPITFTDEQIAAIEANPLLKILYLNEEEKKGKIVYPSAKKRGDLGGVEANQKLITDFLHVFIDMYNEPAGDDPLRIIKRAADLQRCLVSIHPFRDGNGRLSRLLMNAYLEKHGLSPAILEHSEDDLFFTQEDWQEEVAKGSQYYDLLRKKIEEGYATSELVLTREYAEFCRQTVLKDAVIADPSRPMRHKEYNEFLEQSFEEFKKFKDFSSLTVHFSDDKNTALSAGIGQLIPESYIQLWGDTRPVKQEQVRREFYTDIEVFRGGVANDITATRDILKLFTEPTAINSGYRAIKRKRVSSQSIKKMEKTDIQRTMSDWNALLIADYYRRQNTGGNGSKKKDFSKVDDEEMKLFQQIGREDLMRSAKYALEKGHQLSYILNAHQTGGSDKALWASPAVSTSASKEQGVGWARRATRSNPWGIAIKSLLPKYGVVYTPEAKGMALMKKGVWAVNYPHEKEFMVMGGIDPNAVTELTLYNNKNTAIATAKRDGEKILFRDLEESIEEEYVFDENGELKLVKVERFTIPETTQEKLTTLKELQSKASQKPLSDAEVDEIAFNDSYHSHSVEKPKKLMYNETFTGAFDWDDEDVDPDNNEHGEPIDWSAPHDEILHKYSKPDTVAEEEPNEEEQTNWKEEFIDNNGPIEQPKPSNLNLFKKMKEAFVSGKAKD